MRLLTTALAASVLVGCAARPTPAAPAAAAARPATATSSAGLAFDPPVAAHTPTPDLSRDARTPAVTNGIQPVTTTYDVSTYLQDATDDGSYDQQTVTERTGTVQH